MMRAAVEVHVGGQLYRLVASSGEQTLQRYAGVVNDRLRELTGSERTSHPQAMLLVAMALAHDLEQERARLQAERRNTEEMLRQLLGRVNEALDGVDENGDPLAPLPSE
ncbi:MAG TPA: cell division protein ZapA [Polyangiaceae bacterium]|jgi:cell division protein ZapA|nr:cell division protein ZapA [Polyangiaceae bacterium]